MVSLKTVKQTPVTIIASDEEEVTQEEGSFPEKGGKGCSEAKSGCYLSTKYVDNGNNYTKPVP